MLIKTLINTLTILLILSNMFAYYKCKKTKACDKHLTYYFIIMSLFLAFDFIIFHQKKYQFIKFLLILWLSIPSFGAPAYIYHRFIECYFKNNEVKIDYVAKNIKRPIKWIIIKCPNMKTVKIGIRRNIIAINKQINTVKQEKAANSMQTQDAITDAINEITDNVINPFKE
ncbi:hypothetical protein TCON_0483 [Astathelohania contejeani]|uniref:Uncharacterized protein n=1 Tax=Astathelohania contejeani TaxID=164912 RepID=A0ABQ7I1N8_9MICR|nr:hypothetical protein TCON_0483 [Thelohania contejeani]